MGIQEQLLNIHTIPAAAVIILNIAYFLRTSYLKNSFFGEILGQTKILRKTLTETNYEERSTKAIQMDLREKFDQFRDFKGLWNKFENSLFFLDPIEKQPVYAPASFATYLNVENLLHASKRAVSFQIWHLAPQVLTSIGIIGTFLSILVSLYFLSGVETITDKYIMELVRSLAFGFVSSLVGVASAALFSHSEKTKLKKLSGELSEVCILVDSHFNALTTDDLLAKQNIALSGLSGEMKSAISSGFTNLQGGMGNALADIMDDQTKETIKHGISQSFTEMNAILKDMRNESSEIKGEMQSLKLARDQVMETIKLIAVDQKQIQNEINQQSSKLKENLESFKEIIAPLAEVAKQVKETNDLSERLITAVSTVKIATDSIGTATGNLEKANSEVLKKYDEQVKKINDGYGGLSGGVQSWVDASNTAVAKNLKEFDEKVGNVLQKVGQIATSLNASVLNLDRIKKAEVALPAAPDSIKAAEEN